MKPDDLIGVLEAATLLRCSESTVYRLKYTGVLPYVEFKGMRKLMFKRSEVLKLMKEQVG